MKTLKKMKLFILGKDYCPNCLNEFTKEQQKKYESGYNLTCGKCSCYIENWY